MDPLQIAGETARFMSPFVPYLTAAGERAAEEAGQRFGTAAWERARAIWSRLRLGECADGASHDPNRVLAGDELARRVLAAIEGRPELVSELRTLIQGQQSMVIDERSGGIYINAHEYHHQGDNVGRDKSKHVHHGGPATDHDADDL